MFRSTLIKRNETSEQRETYCVIKIQLTHKYNLIQKSQDSISTPLFAKSSTFSETLPSDVNCKL